MPPRALTTLLSACLLASACAAPAASAAKPGNGGFAGDPPVKKARIVKGVAVAPTGAPRQVVQVIQAANRIVRMPYHYGGGHRAFTDSGYDCSGSVSFALHGAGLLSSPLDSSSFMRWGRAGSGRWMTIYSNPGHAFLIVAGLRFDTGWRDATVRGTYPGSGPRWGHTRPTTGFAARHPAGL
jgi:hypothetical protein